MNFTNKQMITITKNKTDTKKRSTKVCQIVHPNQKYSLNMLCSKCISTNVVIRASILLPNIYLQRALEYLIVYTNNYKKFKKDKQ